MDDKKQAAETRDELIGVLTAISIVAKRLAVKLARLESIAEGGDMSDGSADDNPDAPDADQSDSV